MTLYLSRMMLNRHAPTRALSALLDPQDPDARADAHHRLIWTLFGDARNRPRDFLWRAEPGGRFYTLSARPPQGNDLFTPPQTKTFEPLLAPGDTLAFALRANATQDRAAISRLPAAERRGQSRRVDLVMHMLRDVPQAGRAACRHDLARQAATDWMTRQGAAKGFRLSEVEVQDYRVLTLGRSGKRRGMTHGVMDLTGRLCITNPDLFLPALASGLGRAKAWGCGLMLIRRDR